MYAKIFINNWSILDSDARFKWLLKPCSEKGYNLIIFQNIFRPAFRAFFVNNGYKIDSRKGEAPIEIFMKKVSSMEKKYLLFCKLANESLRFI